MHYTYAVAAIEILTCIASIDVNETVTICNAHNYTCVKTYLAV